MDDVRAPRAIRGRAAPRIGDMFDDGSATARMREASPAREQTSLRCDACGARNPAGYHYCVECGARSESTLAYGAVVQLALASAPCARVWFGVPSTVTAVATPPAAVDGIGSAPAQDTERRAMDMGWVQMLGGLASASAADLVWEALGNEDITGVWSPESDGVPEPIAAGPTVELALEPAAPRRAATIDEGFEPPTERYVATTTTAVATPPSAAVLIELAADSYPGQGTPSAVHFIGRGGAIDVGRACTGPGEDDPYLDAWHARLTSHGEGLMLHDPGSRGGVWMRLSSPRWLRDGDRFRLGQQFLTFDAAHGQHDSGRCGGDERGRIQSVYDGRRVGLTMSICAPMVLGRAGTDVVLGDDPYVSVAHCRLTPEGDGVQLEDLGSSNGTWVRLRSGDVIPFGALVAIGRSTYRIESAER